MPYLLPPGIADKTRQAIPWLQRGSWTILDQAFFSGANFVTNILLARWLTVEGYGTFAVGYAIFLFMSTIHTGFLTEPMLVFTERFRNESRSYFSLLNRGHITLSSILSVVLMIVGLFFIIIGHVFLGRELIILAVALPIILWMWLIRRACYAKMQPHLATIGSFLYACIVITGITIVSYWGLLSVGVAFGVISIASLLSGLWIAKRIDLLSWEKSPVGFRSEALSAHFGYGKWAAPTRSIEWTSGQFALLIIPVWGGIAASGEFKALDNLLMPASQVFTALYLLLLPVFSRSVINGDLKQKATTSILAILGLMLGFWVALVIFGPAIVSLLYGAQYEEISQYLMLAGLIPVIAALSAGLGTVSRALNYPKDIFRANIAAVLFAVTVGIFLISKWAITGAILYHIGALLIESIILAWLLFKRTRSKADITAPSAETVL